MNSDGPFPTAEKDTKSKKESENIQGNEEVNKTKNTIIFKVCIFCIILIMTFLLWAGDKSFKPPTEEKISVLIRTLNPLLDPQIADIYKNSILIYSKQYGFTPEFVTCLIARASGFNQVAETIYPNGKKLIGLMQVDSELSSPFINDNIQNGCKIFKEILIKNNGDIETSLNEYFHGNNELAYDILKIFSESMITYN